MQKHITYIVLCLVITSLLILTTGCGEETSLSAGHQGPLMTPPEDRWVFVNFGPPTAEVLPDVIKYAAEEYLIDKYGIIPLSEEDLEEFIYVVEKSAREERNPRSKGDISPPVEISLHAPVPEPTPMFLANLVVVILEAATFQDVSLPPEIPPEKFAVAAKLTVIVESDAETVSETKYEIVKIALARE